MRTFCIITTTANELVGEIHDRMPVILPPDAYDRWLANIEPDPRDLLVPFPSELMKIWPISTRVNKPENDDPGDIGASRGRGWAFFCSYVSHCWARAMKASLFFRCSGLEAVCVMCVVCGVGRHPLLPQAGLIHRRRRALTRANK